MSTWRVLAVAAFGITCLGLVLATLVAPISIAAEDHRWLWFTGLLVASLCMTSLFVVFLKYSDRTMKR